MPGLLRVPPAVGQGLAIAGLAACFFGVALPHLRKASGEGARTELAESEAYLEARVDEFARVNGLSPNHSFEVQNYRWKLADELDIPALRRAAAASAGSDKATPTAPVVVFVGLALLALGCLFMVWNGQTGHAVWAGFLVLALAAGGVALHEPDASGEVPRIDGPVGRQPTHPDSKPPEVGASDRGLCEHVMKIALQGQPNPPSMDALLDSCVKALQQKSPSAEQRRCLMRAHTSQELQACHID